jgi:hypothetical protein
MYCNLKWLSVIAIMLILGTGCGKETSVEPPVIDSTGIITGGSAHYAVGNCLDAGVSGTFQVGKALGADAKIIIRVSVTKTGSWSMATPLTNGMIFAGAGQFNATGEQTITLQGTGTPTTAGVKTIPYATCGVDVITLPADNNNGSSSDYYYSITIDGKTYSQSVTMTNDYEAGSGLGGGDDVTISASINYGYDNPPAGSTSFGITIGTMHNYMYSTKEQFRTFFKTGARNYTKDFNVADGVSIGWSDPNGVEWGTSYGTGDQTGSTFTIISNEDVIDLTNTFYLKTKVQFKCKLYNKNTGEVKTVTNGEMVGSFGQI